MDKTYDEEFAAVERALGTSEQLAAARAALGRLQTELLELKAENAGLRTALAKLECPH